MSALPLEESVTRMLRGMELVASRMVVSVGERYELTESIPAAVVQELLGTIFPGAPLNLLAVLLNSVLTPHSHGGGPDVPIGFSLRVLQEYFLASHLVSGGADAGPYPDGVRRFVEDIIAGS